MPHRGSNTFIVQIQATISREEWTPEPAHRRPPLMMETASVRSLMVRVKANSVDDAAEKVAQAIERQLSTGLPPTTPA